MTPRLRALAPGRWHRHLHLLCAQARTPPASWYTGAAEPAEQRAVFRGNWLMAGSSADLERRQGGHQNNFYTLSLAGMPLLVARGADGRLRAFHNARPRSSF